MEERRHLVLAACIGEWATLLVHLNTLGDTEFRDRIADELHMLVMQWPDVRLPITYGEIVRVIQDARVFAGERLVELEELLNDE